MHRRAEFREDRLPVLYEAIRQIQFATLITQSAAEFHASHLPTVLKLNADATQLHCHVAIGNPQWKTVQDGTQALLVFPA